MVSAGADCSLLYPSPSVFEELFLQDVNTAANKAAAIICDFNNVFIINNFKLSAKCIPDQNVVLT
jgi:hypothetical protein